MIDALSHDKTRPYGLMHELAIDDSALCVLRVGSSGGPTII
jgi:hypothetical protein